MTQKLNGRFSNQVFDVTLTALSYLQGESHKPPPVFPFHKVCYEIFERAIAFTKGSPSVDGNLLYHVMAGLSGHDLCHLDIDYGPMSGMGHCWVSKPGEEVRPTHARTVEADADRVTSSLSPIPTTWTNFMMTCARSWNQAASRSLLKQLSWDERSGIKSVGIKGISVSFARP